MRSDQAEAPRSARTSRRKFVLPAVGAALATLLAAAPAHAVGDGAPVDINRFHPAPGNAKILSVDLAETGPHLQVVPQLFLHYSYRPLVYTVGGDPVADLIKHRLTGDLSVSLALWRRLQIALALPVTLYQSGEYPSDGFLPPPTGTKPLPMSIATAGQEDLRLIIKGVFWNNRTFDIMGAHFGIGGIADLTLPTGNADSYLGSPLPTAQLKLNGHIQWRRLTAAINIGAMLGRPEQLYNIKTGYGITYGVGAQVEIGRYRIMPFYLLAEVFGITHYPFDSLKTSPAELSVALKTSYRNWTMFLGGGPGLNPGYGVPDGRVFAGVSYAWQKVPQAPKPPPPRDDCPNLPGAQEGIPPGLQKDNTGNCVEPPPPPPPPPIPPPACEGDACPDAPKKPATVEIVHNKLNLSDRIFFDFDKDTIKPISFPILDEVVRVIKVRPDIKRMRIEGHTDNYGADMYNLDLSHRRAAAVMVYLVEHGIETYRLTSAGFGFRCPIVPNDTPDNRAKNRRVDFIIVEQDGVPPEAPRCVVPNR